MGFSSSKESLNYCDLLRLRFLIDQIVETGLEPTAPPPPLPPIEQDEIELLCWMGIECGTSGEGELTECRTKYSSGR